MGNRVRYRFSIGRGAFRASYRQGVDVDEPAGAGPVCLGVQGRSARGRDAEKKPLTSCRKSLGHYQSGFPACTAFQSGKAAAEKPAVEVGEEFLPGVSWERPRDAARVNSTRASSCRPAIRHYKAEEPGLVQSSVDHRTEKPKGPRVDHVGLLGHRPVARACRVDRGGGDSVRHRPWSGLGS